MHVSLARALRRGSISLALGALAAAPAVAQPYTLERKLSPGARWQVEERRNTSFQALWRGPNAAVGNAEASEVVRSYTEEVRSAQPEVLVREFALSTRAKHHPQAPAEPLRTSVHGRRVLVSGLERRPDGPFELSKEDGDELRFERLAAALVKAERPVAPRDSWTVSGDALAEALFGDYVAAANRDGGAKVELRGVKSRNGRTLAQLKVKLQLHLTRTETVPGLELNLKGELEWAIEEGALAAARLEGPLTFVFGHQAGRGELVAEGTTRWTYAAEPLLSRAGAGRLERAAGAAPPPGALALVCAKNPAHKIPLVGFARCIQCGKPLDPERRCPDEHPWGLQYCPWDGAPFEAK